MKHYCKSTLAALAIAVGTAAPTLAADWDMPLPWPDGNFHTKNAQTFADEVAKVTEGRVNITVHAGGSLGFKGPEMLGVIRRRRLILNIPFWAARIMAAMMELVQTISLGLIPPQITRDQVKSLRVDNIVSPNAKGLADLGIEPTATEAVLPDYLWRFRPAGQYEAIKESAENLRA